MLVSRCWTSFSKWVLRRTYESRHKSSSLFINFWKSWKINIFGWARLRCPVLTSRYFKIFENFRTWLRKISSKYRTCSEMSILNPKKSKCRHGRLQYYNKSNKRTISLVFSTGETSWILIELSGRRGRVKSFRIDHDENVWMTHSI